MCLRLKSNHLRGLLSAVAYRSSPSDSPWPQRRGTSCDCLPNDCAHTPSRAPEKVLVCVQFPVPYHRQPIFPLLPPRVLSIKADASGVLWCAVWLPCMCSAWLPHLSLLSLHTGTSSITASLEHSQNLVRSAALAQSHVTLLSRSLCPQAAIFFPGNVTSSIYFPTKTLE